MKDIEYQTTLRDRCQMIADKIMRDGILRQGSSADTIMEFVESERGRAADSSLKDTKPLILYFGNDQDREEFMSLVHEIKPGMIARKMP